MISGLPTPLITQNATTDNLSEQDYKDIFEELRSTITLRQFISLSGSSLSPARWSQWAGGSRPLSREMKKDLRRAVNLDGLPPTIEEAISSVHPDAAVAQIGEDKVHRVLLIGLPGPVTVHWNGNGPQAHQNAPRTVVTGVTATKPARRYWRPALPPELGQRTKNAGVTKADIQRAIEELLRRREL